MLIGKVREKKQIASHKIKNYFMKSKHFSNDFENKMQDLPFNTGQGLKPLSVLASTVPYGASADINCLKNQIS
jgi:hypothetical protein